MGVTKKLHHCKKGKINEKLFKKFMEKTVL
jgi:hypothetical protein